MGTPFQEPFVNRARRLLFVVALTVAPLAAACVASPTSPDNPTRPTPTDTTGRKEQSPWN